jgi:hypothetical protein
MWIDVAKKFEEFFLVLITYTYAGILDLDHQISIHTLDDMRAYDLYHSASLGELDSVWLKVH